MGKVIQDSLGGRKSWNESVLEAMARKGNLLYEFSPWSGGQPSRVDRAGMEFKSKDPEFKFQRCCLRFAWFGYVPRFLFQSL